jgi:hypothetical protein
MPTMIFTYSPKAGVSAEAFEKFLAEVDQPATLRMPSAISSRIMRITSEKAPFAYVETLEVTSCEQFLEDGKDPALAPVLAQWGDFGNVSEVKAYKAQECYVGKKA